MTNNNHIQNNQNDFNDPIGLIDLYSDPTKVAKLNDWKIIVDMVRRIDKWSSTNQYNRKVSEEASQGMMAADFLYTRSRLLTLYERIMDPRSTQTTFDMTWEDIMDRVRSPELKENHDWLPKVAGGLWGKLEFSWTHFIDNLEAKSEPDNERIRYYKPRSA